jgi:hypothetical protein
MGRLRINKELAESLQNMSDVEVDAAISQLLTEKKERAMDRGDVDVILRESMQVLFAGSGIEAPRVMSPGIIALPNLHTETSADKHHCNMYTVVSPDGHGETWAWDEEAETFIHSDRAKVGKIFRSVSLHMAVNDLIFVRHNRTHNGQRHVPQSCVAYKVAVEYDSNTGEVVKEKVERLPEWTPSHLPPPIGMEDSNAYEESSGKR